MLRIGCMLGFASLTTLAHGQAGPETHPFPPSTPLAEGLSPEAFDRLAQKIQTWVDTQEVVGAELLVIKNGRTVWHQGYGLADQEAKTPMGTDHVFCLRSMTKPVVGTAILMLVQDHALKLEDPVSKYLPAFDREGWRTVTVENLLTHTAGLPLSCAIGHSLDEWPGIQALVEAGTQSAPLFEPGSAFHYSDQGADSLTALVEVVSGMPAAEFVQTRILDPLGMQSSACSMALDEPLRARALPGYVGSQGAWKRFWGPKDPALFPFFLGSQGLYASITDYARFMDFWAQRGRWNGERLLGPRWIRKALTPGSFDVPTGTGFPDVLARYGYLMELWVGAESSAEVPSKGSGKLIAFGHNGSDGTHAWVFPEQKAMAFYFTQSRNNTTGFRVEESLAELFLGQAYDPNLAAPPLEEYLGYYWEGPGDLYRAVVRDGDDLCLEILAKAVVPLTYLGEDRWKMRPNPSVVLQFDRDESGQVTGYHIGDHQEFRFTPAADLPSAESLAAQVAKAHRFDRIQTLGPLAIHRKLDLLAMKRAGDLVTYLEWPNRFRTDLEIDGQFERVAFDGEQVRYATSAAPAETLLGARAQSQLAQCPWSQFGDWSRWHTNLHVIQSLEWDDVACFLVRAGDTSAPATTFYVEADTGRVLGSDGMVFIETLGSIGQRMRLEDFRDFEGILLPYRTRIALAHPLLGEIESTIEAVEAHAELPAGGLELDEE
ncbi:MAG TPA: serine hydrolase domain-containing protein [Planctomycetota bacterium]|nr:serine hydrolase domain-containing protein [Planctomycetota bacterium]